jgi:hypothetical protein
MIYIREVPVSKIGRDIDCFVGDFRGFPQCLQPNAEVVPQIRPLLLPSTSLSIDYSLLCSPLMLRILSSDSL